MNTASAPHTAEPSRAARQQAVVAALQAVLPAQAILYTPEDTTPYECDGLTAYREKPLAVALPETEEQVAAVLRTGYQGYWSLEIFNDRFRAASTAGVALDGSRSLQLLDASAGRRPGLRTKPASIPYGAGPPQGQNAAVTA